jgi:hypothetical protein
MPNIETVGGNDEAKVACAILCCDKATYKMQKSGRDDKECQRLNNRKHSCVLHALRKKENGKLTQDDRFTGITANKKFEIGSGKAKRTRRPDILTSNPKKMIDAKFPCNTEDLKKGWKQGKVQCTSDSRLGTAMFTDKDEVDYTKIAKREGYPEPEMKTPEDAKKDLPGGCDCTKMQQSKNVVSF